MLPVVLLVIYCLLVALGSLAGGWIPLVVRLTHTRMQLAMSFIGGAMLGVGVLHLLPHAFYELNDIQWTAWCVLCGFLATFFLERVFHFHHHDAPDQEGEEHACDWGNHGVCQRAPCGSKCRRRSFSGPRTAAEQGRGEGEMLNDER